MFDFRQAEHSAESVLADVRAAGFSKIELRPFFTPQRRALPGVALSVLGLVERTGPLALWLSKRFGRVFCSASRLSAPGLMRRRVAAFAGVYGSVALGLATSLVVLRVLDPAGAGRFTIVVGLADFLAQLVWLTSDDALVKYGFRYAAGGEWGRFHRLVGVAYRCEAGAALLASLLIVAIAPFADSIFAHGAGLEKPLLVAALLPPLQALESIAAATLILNGRYDLRGIWLTISIGLRLAGIWIGAQNGVTAAVVGVVVAQVLTTVSILAISFRGLRTLPACRAGAARRRPRADHPLRRPERRLHRADLGADVGRAAHARHRPQLARRRVVPRGAAPDDGPQRGVLAAADDPAQRADPRLGARAPRGGAARGFAATSRARRGAAALALIPAWVLMPWLVRVIVGRQYLPAVPAARLILVAGAIQLVLSWTKTFPVTIGRPGLRLWAHGVETAVMLPLIVVLGKEWGVTGAGAAVLVSSVAFALAWVVILLRLRRTGLTPASSPPTGVPEPGRSAPAP